MNIVSSKLRGFASCQKPNNGMSGEIFIYHGYEGLSLY